MKRDELISSEYVEMNRQLHGSERGFGHSGRKHASQVHAMCAALGCKSILDYGAGGGTLRSVLLSQNPPASDVREYDPAVEGIDETPAQADLVTCTDVLEHVEPDRLDAVLGHIRSLTRRAAFLVISTQPAHKTLRDGRNAHLIVQAPEWWLSQILAHRFVVLSQFVRSNEDGVADVTFWVLSAA